MVDSGAVVIVLSVILPVKNEPYLSVLLNDINDCLRVPFEVRVQTEKGLGYAVMCGVKQAVGDVIVVCDADGSHNPKYISGMALLASGSYDVVVGSRYVAGGCSCDSFVRMLISRFYCLFAKILFGLNVKDSMSGFVAVKRNVFEVFPISNKGFKFNLELLVKSKGVFNVAEYPIVFEKRKIGESKASPLEAIKTLLFMLRLWAKK